MRVLVGGIGYRNLRDHSVGVTLSDRFMAAGLSAPGVDVVVEDLSYNPLAVGWRLDDEPLSRRFDRLILVGGIARGTRLPGSIVAYRWDRVLPDAEEIQRAVTEAVTGIISIDNTLVILAHFGTLPPEAVVVEIEPFLHEFGEQFSAPVMTRFDELCALVETLAIRHDELTELPLGPLGGHAVPAVRAEA